MNNSDRPLGWRARLGVLSPTVMETMIHDFVRVAPDGVTQCAITSNVEHWDNENFKTRVIDPLLEMSKYLSSRGVNYIMHCGMPVVTLRGRGFDEEIVGMISKATGLPASTSIRSAILALKHMKIRRVAVISPYPQGTHQSAIKFLNESGIDVIAEHTEDVVFKQLQDVTPLQIAAVANRVYQSVPDIEGIYIPCNQWRAFEAAILLEQDLPVPVISGAHADLWEAFRVLNIRDPLHGNGRLMESLRTPG